MLYSKISEEERYEVLIERDKKLIRQVYILKQQNIKTVAKYDFTRTVEGKTETSTYSNIVVWVKQADGSWKMAGP